VEKPKKKKKSTSSMSSGRGLKTSSRSPILKERVHISPDGTIDITEETASGKIEKVHVGRDGSVDVSEHRRTAEDILSKYRKRPSPSTTTKTSTRPMKEKIHVGKDGTIDITETSEDGKTEKVHIGRRGSIDVMNKTSDGVTERVHIGKNGDVTIRESTGKLRETVRSVRARSARISIISLKYFDYRCITHSHHYILDNFECRLYHSLRSLNITKYLTRASRSNTGTRSERRKYRYRSVQEF
jgi:hypothetical protein